MKAVSINTIKQHAERLSLTEADTLKRKVSRYLSNSKSVYTWQERRLLVSHRYAFLYCPIYKIASSSMMNFMVLANAPKKAQKILSLDRNKVRSYVLINFSLEGYSDEYKSKVLHGSYFKFIFVRNPWARLVSTYSNFFVSAYSRGKTSEIAKNVARSIYGEDANFYSDKICFRDLVEYVYMNKDEVLDRHTMAQSSLMGKVRYDFVGRLETFDADFEHIRNKVGFEKSLLRGMQRSNSTRYSAESKHIDQSYDKALPVELSKLDNLPPYSNFYTPDLIEKVGERYSSDIQKYSYTFDAWR